MNTVKCQCDLPALKEISWLLDEIGRRFWCCPKNKDDESRCNFKTFVDEPFDHHADGVIQFLRTRVLEYRRVIVMQTETIVKLRERVKEVVDNLDLFVGILVVGLGVVGLAAVGLLFALT